jgi:Tol biopolymer transport system component
MRVLRTAVPLLASAALYAGCGEDTTVPSKTGDAGKIVYAAEREGAPTQLVTINPDGSAKKQITHAGGDGAVNPDWSPSGSKIVYEGDSPENAGIIVINADGSGARNLTPTGNQGQPSFSPDGKRIVFERDPAPGDNGVWIMNVDGSGLKRLTQNPFAEPDKDCGCDTDPNFAPDGRAISFVRIKDADTKAALFSILPDGTRVRRLTPYGDDVATKHAWAPNSERIVITTNANPEPGESANVLTMNPSGTGRRRVTDLSGGASAYVGSFSPDGTQIAFRLEDEKGYSLAVMPSGGGTVKRLWTSKDIKPRFIDWGRGAG